MPDHQGAIQTKHGRSGPEHAFLLQRPHFSDHRHKQRRTGKLCCFCVAGWSYFPHSLVSFLDRRAATRPTFSVFLGLPPADCEVNQCVCVWDASFSQLPGDVALDEFCCFGSQPARSGAAAVSCVLGASAVPLVQAGAY